MKHERIENQSLQELGRRSLHPNNKINNDGEECDGYESERDVNDGHGQRLNHRMIHCRVFVTEDDWPLCK